MILGCIVLPGCQLVVRDISYVTKINKLPIKNSIAYKRIENIIYEHQFIFDTLRNPQ